MYNDLHYVVFSPRYGLVKGPDNRVIRSNEASARELAAYLTVGDKVYYYIATDGRTMYPETPEQEAAAIQGNFNVSGITRCEGGR